jgi:hypothetical protein
MFGLPEDYFGEGPFGISDWGRLAIYNSVPVLHRTLDETEGDLYLKRYFAGFQNQLEEIIQDILTLPNQRLPLLARAGIQNPLLLISSTTSGATTVVDTFVPHGFSAGQFVVFTGTEGTSPAIRGVQSVAQVLSPTQFSIAVATGVSTASTGTVKVYDAGSVPVLVTSAVRSVDPDYGSVVEFTVEWQTDLDLLGVGYTASLVAGGVSYTFSVARLRTRNQDDPSLPSPPYGTAERNKILCYASGIPDASVLALPYQLLFVQPSSLRYLTGDFGLTFDENDPVFFQRSLVRNVSQYVMLKGSERGYEIRSNVAGFNATAQGLYSICADSAPDGLPADHVFVYDGAYYTDLPPQYFCFDDIPADIEYTDPESASTIYPLDALMYGDTSGDALSPAAAVARCITEYYVGTSGSLPYVTNVVAASAGQLAPFGFAYGQVVTVQFASLDDYEAFSVVAQGVFSLVGPQPDGTDEHFIEDELSWNAGTLVAEYLVGSPATFPVSYDPLDPAASEYCIRYRPAYSLNCCYCKSYKIRLILEPTQRLYDDLGGSGAAVNGALTRLVAKIQREQLPIHAKIVDVVLNVPISVTSVPSVTITSIVVV